MAELKITCPNCFSTDKCFEDVQEANDSDKSFSSFMCFNCGFTSNSAYTWDSIELKKAQTGATQLMNDVALFDEGRNLMWFPSVLNMGKLGVIYPEGTKDNWVYKLAQVRPLTELEKKDEKYNGHTEMLDVEKAETFGQYECLEACQKMGIIKELD